MKKKNNNMRDFEVGMVIKTWVTTHVNASSVEEAAAKLKEMTPEDFITYNGECVDHSFVPVGITDYDNINTDL